MYQIILELVIVVFCPVFYGSDSGEGRLLVNYHKPISSGGLETEPSVRLGEVAVKSQLLYAPSSNSVLLERALPGEHLIN